MRLRDCDWLMCQLNLEETLKITPDALDLGLRSRKKAVWICEKHGDYVQAIDYRNHGHVGCKICDKINKYGCRTTYLGDTEHINEIDIYECRKHEVDPYTTKISDYKTKLFFRCRHNHLYEMSAGAKYKGHNCPICMTRKPDRPDSIAKMRPDLTKFYSKNNEYSAFEIGVNSLDKVEWICKHGHIFKAEAKTQNQTDYPADNVRCPYCSNLKTLAGYNDFASANPHLMDEWDWEKNNELGIYPDQLAANSSVKAHWICRRNPKHTWVSALLNRNAGSGCPLCFSSRQVSTQEVTIKIMLEDLGFKVSNRLKLDDVEFDVYCEDLNLLIEYHGMAWHEPEVSDRDLLKKHVADKHGYDFIIIRETRYSNIENTLLTREADINTIYYDIGVNYNNFGSLLKTLVKIINKVHSKNIKLTDLDTKRYRDEARQFLGLPLQHK